MSSGATGSELLLKRTCCSPPNPVCPISRRSLRAASRTLSSIPVPSLRPLGVPAPIPPDIQEAKFLNTGATCDVPCSTHNQFSYKLDRPAAEIDVDTPTACVPFDSFLQGSSLPAALASAHPPPSFELLCARGWQEIPDLRIILDGLMPSVTKSRKASSTALCSPTMVTCGFKPIREPSSQQQHLPGCLLGPQLHPRCPFLAGGTGS